MFKIKNADLLNDVVKDPTDYPKYTTQLMNLANQNAQGTRPKVVGQMSDLIQVFPGQTYDDWVEWYLNEMPTAIDDATDKIFDMIVNLKEAIDKIDKELVRKWVEDLVVSKTFVGLKFQESIIKRIAAQKGQPYRLATREEESLGIDGYIGGMPVSIKPHTYKTKPMLSEKINATIIYYEKKRDGLSVEFDM